MRKKVKKISALFLAITILMSGFPGMFSENKVFAQERGEGFYEAEDLTNFEHADEAEALMELPDEKVLKKSRSQQEEQK